MPMHITITVHISKIEIYIYHHKVSITLKDVIQDLKKL